MLKISLINYTFYIGKSIKVVNTGLKHKVLNNEGRSSRVVWGAEVERK